MKFTCHCGGLIPDQTDDLPYKGHLLPDQCWQRLWDRVEEQVLAKIASGALSFEAGAMSLRRLISGVFRLLYQCPACGRLYIADEHGNLNCYGMNSSTDSRSILHGNGH